LNQVQQQQQQQQYHEQPGGLCGLQCALTLFTSLPKPFGLQQQIEHQRVQHNTRLVLLSPSLFELLAPYCPRESMDQRQGI
jgi:hypothetical protein